MLLELWVRDFAIIDSLHVKLEPGMTVLTGETGAGKSIIVDAVNLLLGGRADSDMVRTGAKHAQIEGRFNLFQHTLARSILEREALVGDGPDRLLLTREVRISGRSVSRVNGRLVNLSLLREISAGMVDIHGQSEHLSLKRTREHLFLLDKYAELDAVRDRFAAHVVRLNKVRSDLNKLVQDERTLAQRTDLLQYQINEINQAGLEDGEDKLLEEERSRLANAEQLASLAEQARAMLEQEIDSVPAVQDSLGHVARSLSALARIDASQVTAAETANQLAALTDELISTLRDYRESIEFNPQRLHDVEERLEFIRRLKRKYGDTLEQIAQYARDAESELENISHSEERIIQLEEEQTELLQVIGEEGWALSQKRREAAERLSKAVVDELESLSMSGSRFAVDLTNRDDPSGAPVPTMPHNMAFDRTGLDKVEFLISANPGESLKPITKIASGGETARLMLAIKSVLAQADPTPVLIFDEIDQGIGGRVGRVVGEKLWGLVSEERQVMCITHLPQLASYADIHFRVSKRVQEGRTVTVVDELDHEGVIKELALMHGADSAANRDSARDSLNRASLYKSGDS